MTRIDYDFSTFLDVFNKMKLIGTPTSEDLRVIKDELNKFFKDSKCKEVLYTTNIDKMFFGIKLVPLIDADDIYEYLIEDEPSRLDTYVVELDSHLLDPILDLSAMELLSILIHEVGHLIGDSSPIENARKALDAYLTANKDHIKISQSIHYKELLAYGLKDYLSKAGSMFYINDPTEIMGDELAAAYGLSDSLTSAYGKINKNNIKLYENSEISRFITFSWVLSVYKNLRIRRVGTIRTLNRAIQLTGSRLEKMEMENVIRRIKRIDDDSLLEGSTMDTIRQKLKEKMRKARINNLRTIDNTFYELNMQVRNVEDENDALYLMRQINSSISVIDEYRNSVDCDEYEKEQWNKAMDKFSQLRDRLSKTVVYKNKNYGLFVNYPDIVENRY